MSFGLSRGRVLDRGEVGLTREDLPPLPDDLHAHPESGRLDPRQWFDIPSLPFELEIGSGKGTFLVQQAELQPGTNFLGIEWAKEFALYAADRLRRRHLRNVKLLHADAFEFVKYRMPSGIVRVLHLYFPDPWPKSRHHKRRMVSDAFLKEAHRILEPGGELRIVTDHADYWQWMNEHFDRWCAPEGVTLGGVETDSQSRGLQPARAQTSVTGAIASIDKRSSDPTSAEQSHHPLFERLPFEKPDSAAEGELVGTNFERKYRREGRPFCATILKRI